MRNQEIVFGVSGQRFFFDPPDLARPSSPTVQVWLATNDDVNPTEAATTGACEVDAVDTALDGDVAQGATILVVDSGASIIRGQRYLLTAGDGRCERVEVLRVSGETIGLRHPLVNDYADGAAFQGTRISIAVDTAWASNASHLTDVLSGSWRTDRPVEPDAYIGQAGYRLRWVYTVGANLTIGASFADLVRYQAQSLVTPIDVDARFPGWIDRLGPDYREDQGASLVLEAFHAVRMDAIADAVLLRKVRNTEILRELVVLRTNLLQLENQVLAGGGSLSGLEAAQKIYAQRYNQLVREPKFPTDAGGGGASSPSPRLPAWRR